MIGRAGLFVWVLAAAVFVSLAHGGSIPELIYGGVLALLLATVLMRLGLLALVVTISVAMTLASIPRTVDPSSWFFRDAIFASIFVLGLTAWGARAALAGRPILREKL